MTCDEFSESRRRLLLAVGGGICTVVADTNAAAAETPEDRLRALLSDRRSLRLLRGDEHLEATYWTADAGYNRDEYLNICWLLRDSAGRSRLPDQSWVARRVVWCAGLARSYRC